MSYQVLARKWRPRNFEQMVGQRHVVRALANALDHDRLHHAYLFAGTRGVGKTTLARILAKCLNCERGVGSAPCGECAACREIDEGRFVDLIEVDAASRAKVDETRELMDNVQYAPARGRYKVYLIDEVHMFSAHSFNALLKTLEEPPPHVRFLLATTDPQKLPVTVLSRCLQFNLRRLPQAAIAAHLEKVLASEGIEHEPSAARLVARAADGSMRDALSLLDQAIAYGGGALEAGEVRAMLGTLDGAAVDALLEALAAGDGRALVARVGEMAEQVVDFQSALRDLLARLERIALVQLVPEAIDEPSEEREALTRLAEALAPEDVQLYYQIGLTGVRDLPFAADPHSGFEMLMLRMLAFRPGEAGDLPSGAPPGASRTSPASAAAAGAVEGSAGARRTAGATEAFRAREPEPCAERQGGAIEWPLVPERWPSVVSALGVAGLVRELASNSVLASCGERRVELRVPNACAHLASAQLKRQLEAALAGLRGEPVRLEIRVGEPEHETPAELERQAVEARRQTALAALERDPNVRALCDTFGAIIDKGSIQSLD